MTNVVQTIKDYNEWVMARNFDPDPTGPEAYAKHLETEQELRILKALRRYAIPGSVNMNRTDNVYDILDGDIDVINAVENGEYDEN